MPKRSAVRWIQHSPSGVSDFGRIVLAEPLALPHCARGVLAATRRIMHLILACQLLEPIVDPGDLLHHIAVESRLLAVVARLRTSQNGDFAPPSGT
jgi:hypothetical protein